MMNGKRCGPCLTNASTRKGPTSAFFEHALVLLHGKSDVSPVSHISNWSASKTLCLHDVVLLKNSEIGMSGCVDTSSKT